MKSLDLELLASTGTTYDQTRTTLAGRVSQKTVDSKPVLGPPSTKFVDVFTDSGGLITPTTTLFATENNRIFVLGAITGTYILPVLCYELNVETGATNYIGRVNFRMPQSPTIAHTIRSFKVVDNGTTGWKMYVTSTATALLAGSGTLLFNKIDRADFTQLAPPTVEFATGNDQKAVYQLGRRATMKSINVTPVAGSPVKFNYVGHGFQNNDQIYFTSLVGTAPSGWALNVKHFVRNASADQFEISTTFNGASINNAGAVPTTTVVQEVNQEVDAVGGILDLAANKYYVHVGQASQHQYFVRDTSVAPTYSTSTVSIVSGAAAKITLAGHPYVENEPIQFISGFLPTGFLLNTTYFVRNITANDFELALTAGGTSIAAASGATGVVLGRAFGYTNSQWLFKTGMLPAVAGNLLSNDSEKIATPVDAVINGHLLNNQPCAFFGTTSTGLQMYIGRLDELTSETNNWASLTMFNYQGALNQFVSLTPLSATWVNSISRAVFLAASSVGFAFKLFIKKVENNSMTANFGELGLDWYEGVSRENYELRLGQTPANMTDQSGWMIFASGLIGQRGLIITDLKSDCVFDYSYIVSKVVDVPQNGIIKSVNFYKELVSTSGELDVYYRTSGFGSISGGWVYLDEYQPLSIAGATQIQFKICFKTQSIGHSSPLQVSGASIGIEAAEELSDNWEYSYDDSSSAIPTRVGFRLKKAYPSNIPSTLTFRSFDLSGTQLVNHNITSEAARFNYSSDDGVTWLPLGTIPNVVGTLVRYTFLSPPGVDIRPSLKDS